MDKIEGLIAATYSPFTENGDLNVTLIPSYSDYLKKCGLSGVFVNGTTGEGVSLSLEERLLSAVTWVAQKTAHFKVLIHVGHDSLVAAQRLAKQAQAAGADGIGAMAPSFFQVRDISDLVAYNAAIAAAAPSLPYYYYHLPEMTGAQFPMIDFLQQAEKQIPNLAGIKFTNYNLMDLKLCMEYAGQRFGVLFGRDEILISALILGIKGAIGSTYNYMAPLYVKILEAYQNRDLKLADELQFKAMQVIQILIKYGGGVRAGKSILRLLGLDLGQPRLPNIGLETKAEAALQQELKELNFQEFSVPF